MIDIQRVNHVGIRVADLATSRRFYEKLGFEFVVGPVGPEPVAIMTHPGGVVLNFILNVSADAPTSNVLMDSDVKLPGYTHVALEVSDLDAAIAELTRLQIPLSGGPIDVGSARFAFIRDPDRNVIEFNQPRESSGFKRSGH